MQTPPCGFCTKIGLPAFQNTCFIANFLIVESGLVLNVISCILQGRIVTLKGVVGNIFIAG